MYFCVPKKERTYRELQKELRSAKLELCKLMEMSWAEHMRLAIEDPPALRRWRRDCNRLRRKMLDIDEDLTWERYEESTVGDDDEDPDPDRPPTRPYDLTIRMT